MVGETEDELQLYREKIVAELERRMLVLQDVEGRLAKAQHALGQFSTKSSVASPTTARRQVEIAHRGRLRSAVKALERELEDAKADLERAEVRLQEVDIRLDQFNKVREET